MAKIDVSTIEGYEKMTAEQKVAALEAFETPAPDYSGYVKKDVFDKTASDLAEWKKKHNALLSEEERNKQANEEELNNLRKKVEEMEKDKLVSGHKAQFLALGYDEALADETAKAMANGDTATVFANQKKFLESHDKAYKAQLMGQTPTPPAGSPANGGTDYKKLIEDARARGDVSAEAYYIRLNEQEKHTDC
ncbi:MAG: hypothetical protein J1F03_00185 [Oscillospiraceae bacterium]|nr:hypothetical protein [Oscillospiraceae bacterium]